MNAQTPRLYKYQVYEATRDGSIGPRADGAQIDSLHTARVIAQREIRETGKTYYIIEFIPFSADNPKIVETVRP